MEKGEGFNFVGLYIVYENEWIIFLKNFKLVYY